MASNISNVNILKLCEADIPGSSLQGREPKLLTVTELKRWLGCRGASRSGRKQELVKRVEDYIAGGLDGDLVDPDNGANTLRKVELLKACGCDITNIDPIVPRVPDEKDAGWIQSLSQLPTVDHPCLVRHFATRSVHAVTTGATSAATSDGPAVEDLFYSERAVGKGYRMFQDGHVQGIRFHDLQENARFCFVRCVVLPSMKKTSPYRVWVCLERSGTIKAAYCVCTAGLGGGCTHISAALYALEDFVRHGLREETDVSPTSRLCAWNKPRGTRVTPLPIVDVRLQHARYAKATREKLKPIFHPVPVNHRLIKASEMSALKDDLEAAFKHTVSRDKTGVAEKYGASTYLSALLPTDSSSSESEQSDVGGDGLDDGDDDDVHNDDEGTTATSQSSSMPTATHGQPSSSTALLTGLSMNQFYEKHVVVDDGRRAEVAQGTIHQASSALWFAERRKRITASICKSAASATEKNAGKRVQRRLQPTFFGNAATRYGQLHEDMALEMYAHLKMSEDGAFTVTGSGLVISSAHPWLAASPDGLATSTVDGKGVVEVKCPYSCRKERLVDFAKNKKTFFLKLDEASGHLQLKRTHTYYYQVQLQMYVCGCEWVDFVVWTPREGVFVERITFDTDFFSRIIPRMKSFYFDYLLPAVYADMCEPIS